MKQNTGRIRFLVIAVLALAVSLAACGQITDEDKITELLVSPSEVALKVGSDQDGTAQLTAEFQYESGETADAEVNWESNKPEIATVSAEGLVTAVSEGEASVTATAKTNSELSGTASITVAPADSEDPGNGEPGNGEPGNGEPDNGEPGNGEPGNGEPGNGEPGDGDGESITVALDESRLDLVRTQTWVLNAVVTGAGEGEEGVTWSTSNAGAVSITHEDNEAKLTAIDPGGATIYATSDADPSARASLFVNVTALEIAFDSEFDPLVVDQGEVGELTATISNTFPDADLRVAWSADPSNLIEELDETESISGAAITFTADTVGTVTVTATSVQDDQVKKTLDIEIERAALDTTNVYVGSTVTIADAEKGTRFNPFETIMEGVAVVGVGGTVHVAEGEYPETLLLDRELTLEGAGVGKSIIKQGTALTHPTGLDGHAFIEVTDDVEVTIDSITVSGLYTGSCAPSLSGIRVSGSATLWLENSLIVDLREDTAELSGNQCGIALLVGRDADSYSGTAHLTNVDFYGFQKGAIVADGAGSELHMQGGTIEGEGPTDSTAQNGIQIGRGASGTVKNVTVKDLLYTGEESASASAILLYQAGDVVIENAALETSELGIGVIEGGGAEIFANTFQSNGEGIRLNGTSITVSGNTFEGAGVHVNKVSGDSDLNDIWANNTFPDGAGVSGDTIE